MLQAPDFADPTGSARRWRPDDRLGKAGRYGATRVSGDEYLTTHTDVLRVQSRGG